MPDGIYELSLDNFCTQGGAQILVNDVATSARNTANDEQKAPTARATIAKRFLNTDEYRQRAYGLVTNGEVRIGLQGNLAEGESFYAGDLKLIYREQDSTATVPVLASYCQKSQTYIESDSVYYAGYRTRLAELVEQAPTATNPYQTLMDVCAMQDSIDQSIVLYAELLCEMNRMDVELEYSRSLGMNVEASEAIRAEAGCIYAERSYNTPKLQDFILRLQQAIHTQAHNFFDGDGTAEAPYQIVRATQLDQMHHVLKPDTVVYFCLNSDIDMAGFEWTPLNTSEAKYRYRIDFDGQGHFIRNLTLADDGYPSFFGTLCGNCRNVGFVDAVVRSSRSAAAVLAGYVGHSTYKDEDGNALPCRVENCYFTGSVESKGYVGVVAGVVANKGNLYINNVYSNVEMQGNGGSSNRVGGLVGRVWGALSISHSYAAGPIDAPFAGGIIAGGQTTTTPPSTYDNVIAWNSKLTGTTEAFPFGETMEADLLTDVYHYEGMTVNGEGTTDGKSTEELHAIVARWGEPWHTDPAAGNGYPILAWQFVRGDYREMCGFPKADGISSPSAVLTPGGIQYFNLQGQRVARPVKGIYIIREAGTGKTRKIQKP